MYRTYHNKNAPNSLNDNNRSKLDREIAAISASISPKIHHKILFLKHLFSHSTELKRHSKLEIIPFTSMVASHNKISFLSHMMCPISIIRDDSRPLIFFRVFFLYPLVCSYTKFLDHMNLHTSYDWEMKIHLDCCMWWWSTTIITVSNIVC